MGLGAPGGRIAAQCGNFHSISSALREGFSEISVAGRLHESGSHPQASLAPDLRERAKIAHDGAQRNPGKTFQNDLPPRRVRIDIRPRAHFPFIQLPVPHPFRSLLRKGWDTNRAQDDTISESSLEHGSRRTAHHFVRLVPVALTAELRRLVRQRVRVVRVVRSANEEHRRVSAARQA